MKVAFRHARFCTRETVSSVCFNDSSTPKNQELMTHFMGAAGVGVFTRYLQEFARRHSSNSRFSASQNAKIILKWFPRGWGWGFSIIPRHEKNADSFWNESREPPNCVFDTLESANWLDKNTAFTVWSRALLSRSSRPVNSLFWLRILLDWRKNEALYFLLQLMNKQTLLQLMNEVNISWLR